MWRKVYLIWGGTSWKRLGVLCPTHCVGAQRWLDFWLIGFSHYEPFSYIFYFDHMLRHNEFYHLFECCIFFHSLNILELCSSSNLSYLENVWSFQTCLRFLGETRAAFSLGLILYHWNKTLLNTLVDALWIMSFFPHFDYWQQAQFIELREL